MPVRQTDRQTMPGRLINASDSYVDPGHQFMSVEDRPVPAVRKNARELHGSQNGGRAERAGGDLHAREGKTHFANGADMTAARKLEERQNYQPTSSPTSYQLPGQPLNAAAMFRPQSAMAFSSSSPSYKQIKAMYPARPPSSLGVSWGPSPTRPGVGGNMSYNESDLIVRTHQRGHSYGDGVTLGEGSSGIHYTSERSDDVYTSVARRQDRVRHVEPALGYDTHNSRQQQTQISDKHPGTAGYPRADGNAGRSLGQDNPAFVADDQSRRPGEMTARQPSTSLDMRSAWQRLYGNSPDPGVASRRPSVDDVLSAGKAPSFESALTALSTRQHIGHLTSPQLTHTHLQHPRIATSDPYQPAHNTAGNSSQNGRFTPHTPTNPDFPAGNSSQNGRFTPHTPTNPDFPAGSTSQNGRFTPHTPTNPDFPAGNSSQNGRFTPHTPTNPDFPAGNSSQNGRLTPDNPTRTDLHAGSTSLDHPRTTVRESPTGQSSSNPDPTSGSNNSSQLSAYSAAIKTFSTFQTQQKKSDGGADPMIGPSSKYPQTHMGMRTATPTLHQAGVHTRSRTPSEDKRAESRQSLSSPNFTTKPTSPRRQTSSPSHSAGFRVNEDLTRPPSRFSSAFLDSDDSFGDEYSLQPLDSIFNYNEGGSEDGRVTPRASSQLSPSTSSHAPRVTPRAPGNATSGTGTPGLAHRTSPALTLADCAPRTPDLLRQSLEARTSSSNTGRTTTQQTDTKHKTTQQADIKHKTRLGRTSKDGLRSDVGQHHNPARSRSLDDLRESESDSLMSFDVENTVLTVEPSDQSDRGTVRSHKGSNSVRAQLNRLEGMYSHVIKTLGEASHGTRTRRRWSIGSSDTSSMRHHSHQSWHSRAPAHKLAGRDVKAIGKRFQRLESHVITLARSVAHLSSELRVQNSLSREMENVKQEIQELKAHSRSAACPVVPGNLVRSHRLMTDFERSQGWVPSLTNPRRVNKLTKFFGQEPPLLEIFLKQLGYEKFLKNFEQEHIGMIELPYMTEDKLQSVGIPMGPRLRILQEAQIYFQQANVDVYFV